MTSFLSPSPPRSPDSPCFKDAVQTANGSPETAHGSRGTAPTAMSDEEREAHIRDCAWLMEDAMRRWYESSCFSHRGEASRWRMLMEEAIRGRSAAQVARMEQERGLA